MYVCKRETQQEQQNPREKTKKQVKERMSTCQRMNVDEEEYSCNTGGNGLVRVKAKRSERHEMVKK